MERKTRVFKSYLMQLGLRNIYYDSSVHNKFTVWLTRKFSESELNRIDLPSTTFTDIKEEGMIELTDLHHCKFTTVNDDTKEESEITYEKLKNIPASAYLFSINDCPAGSYIQKDYNYVAYDYKVDELNYYNFVKQYDNTSATNEEDDDVTLTQKAMGTYVEPTVEYSDEASATSASQQVPYLINEYDNEVGAYYHVPSGERVVPVFDENFYAQYWEDNYGFTSAYDADEYDMYGISQEYLKESESQATWDDISAAKVKDGPAVFGAVMVVYNNSIPVSYAQLPFSIKAKTCKVDIRWSSNGIIKVD